MKIKPVSYPTSPKYPLIAAAVAVAALGGGMAALRLQTVWTEEQLEKAQRMYRTAGVPPYDEPRAEGLSSPSPEQQMISGQPMDTLPKS